MPADLLLSTVDEAPLPFRQRLVGKVVLYAILPAMLLVGLVIAAGALRSAAEHEASVHAELADATRVAASELDLENQRLAVLATFLATAQAAFSEEIASDDPARIAVVRTVLAANPDIRTITLVPSTLGSVGQSSGEPRATRITRDPSTPDGLRVERLVDPSAMAALASPSARRGETIRCEPAVRDGAEVIECAAPILRGDARVGFVVLERSLTPIDALVDAIRARVNGDVIVASSTRYISATTDQRTSVDAQLQATAVQGSAFEQLLLTYLEGPGAIRVLRTTDPVDGIDAYYGLTRLRWCGWTLLVRRDASTANAEFWQSLAVNVGIALVGFAALSLVLVLVARGVSCRLERAVHAAKRIADGNLAEAIPAVDAADESGALLSAFDQMTQNLNRIVGQVRHASIQINSTATELAATSRQLEHTASGFGASTTDVAAATRQISTTGDELLRTMQDVADSAAGAAEKAQDSRNGLRSMQTSVRRLDEAAHSVATRLGAISEKAHGINGIVATITKVADETNLLSVNAAIEAEKAGEFGLGFLIVAREIRRLADQTASATLDIERMIRQMQTAVAAGVMEMDHFGESLRTVLHDVDRVGERVQGIIAHVEDDTIRFVQVTEGMRSQAAGARQIDEAMRSLSEGAQRTMESAGEFGDAATDLQHAIGSLKSAVAMIRLREGH